jgi:thioredoxin 1
MKLAKVLDSLAGQFAGRARMGKVNVSEEQDIAGEYGIWGLPRLLIFNRNSKPVHDFKGPVPESELTKVINDLLASGGSPSSN